LQRAPQRVARESLQAFGEMVDSEQEQAESTQERYDGRGIHRLRLESSFSNVEQNHYKISRQGIKKYYVPISPNLVCLAFFARDQVLLISFQQKLRIGLAGICANTSPEQSVWS
jgi:hypothetical protein